MNNTKIDPWEWVRENFDITDSPVKGSTYITPEGKFVDLNGKGYEHIDLVKKMASMGIKAVEDEVIPELQRSGWIRGNGGIKGYAYLEIREIRPTEEQFSAIERWSDSVLSRIGELTVLYLTPTDYEEETYRRPVTGKQVTDSVRNVSVTGKLTSTSES